MSDAGNAKSGSAAWGIFVAVLGAIVLGVAFFAPERLPPGVGLTQVPLEVSFRQSVLGEGWVAIIRNPTGHTLHNVKCMRTDQAGMTDVRSDESWAPGRLVEIGWAEGWRWQSGETLTIAASGFALKTVSCGP